MIGHLMLILDDDLVVSIVLFIYDMFTFTEASLRALLGPLRRLQVLPEALQEESNQLLVRLVLIDLVQLYAPEVLSHTPH